MAMAKMSTDRIIEIVVRIIAIVLSIGAVIAAAISLDKLMDINNSPFSDIITGIIDVASPDVRQATAAAVALAIASGLIIPMEILMVVLRIFKFKLGIFGKIIVFVDLAVIFFTAAGFGVAGILASIAAKDWSDDVLDRIPSALPFSDIATSDITDIRDDMAATAAMSFIAFGSCTILFFFVLSLMVKFKNLDYLSKS